MLTRLPTEADWMTTACPLELATICYGKCAPRRFGGLALKWGNQIRHGLDRSAGNAYRRFARRLLACAPAVQRRTGETSQLFLNLVVQQRFRFSSRAFVHAAESNEPMFVAIHAALLASADRKPSSLPALFSPVGRKQRRAERLGRRERTLRQFCDEFRDVAGNPFRPVAFDPAWRTETVVGLATGIDESGAHERLPILADALEEAGCTDAQVLSHAREPGVHVRGCWLIDMILGRW